MNDNLSPRRRFATEIFVQFYETKYVGENFRSQDDLNSLKKEKTENYPTFFGRKHLHNCKQIRFLERKPTFLASNLKSYEFSEHKFVFQNNCKTFNTKYYREVGTLSVYWIDVNGSRACTQMLS